MRTKDADGRIIYNQFKEKDQALVETFNLEKQADGKLGNHYLWRLVVSVGTDYIDLSKSVCALESDAPLVGDDIVQLGYQGTDDPNRQNAQILAGAGTGSPYIRQYVGINNFILPEEYTRIKPGDNLLTGRMNLQPGSTGSANLTDLPDEVYKAVNIGSVNLLRNTGFTGDYETEDLSAATELSADTELFSKQLEYWTGVATVSADSEAISGYSAAIGSLSQSVSLIKGESYVISYKAKGTSVSVSCGDFSTTQPLTSSYQRYTHKITFNGSGIFLISGTAIVCDLQLERGTIATDWKPSILDNDKSMAGFQAINYIASAIKDGSVDILGGLILANMIQLGNYKDGKMQKVTAGVSGIYNDDDDVAFWAGGKLEQAIRTVMRFRNDPNYQPTDKEWENMANFVVAHGGDVFLRGYIYALGGYFRGKVEIANGKILLNEDGSGQLANGNIKWDAEGNPEFVGKVKVSSPSGYEITIFPEDEYGRPSIDIHDNDGNSLLDISLQYGLSGMVPRIFMNDPSNSDVLYFRPDSMVVEQRGSDGYIYQTQIMGGRIIMVKGSEIVWDQSVLPK